jgi:hypothetical protein
MCTVSISHAASEKKVSFSSDSSVNKMLHACYEHHAKLWYKRTKREHGKVCHMRLICWHSMGIRACLGTALLLSATSKGSSLWSTPQLVCATKHTVKMHILFIFAALHKVSIRFINFETEVLLYLLTAKNNVPTSRMGFTDKFVTLRCQEKIFGTIRIKVRAKKRRI